MFKPGHSKHQILNKTNLKEEYKDLKFEDLSQIEVTFKET